MRKRIIITEKQSEEISSMMISEAFRDRHFFNPAAVLCVKKYLDKHFVKDELTDIDADGRIRYNRVADWMDKNGNVVSQPDLDKVVRMLDSENSIRSLIKNDGVRKKFLNAVVNAWYDGLIENTGIINGLSFIYV